MIFLVIFISLKVKFQTSKENMNILDGHVPCGLEDRNGYYSTYPAGSKYLAIVELPKRDPDRENCVQLGRHLIARVRSRLKNQIY